LTKAKSIREFWDWFLKNEEALFAFEDPGDPILLPLHERLKELDEHLTFEIGPIVDGRREFVISAGGIRRSFAVVERLAKAAPSLPRWTITRFRPRRAELGRLQIGGQEINPGDIEFALEDDHGKAGIHLFIDGYSQGNERLWQQVGFLFLDAALGEYDVETGIGFIQFKPYAFKSGLERHRLTELAARFDAFSARRRKGG
jgi:hypothetical protein